MTRIVIVSKNLFLYTISRILISYPFDFYNDSVKEKKDKIITISILREEEMKS